MMIHKDKCLELGLPEPKTYHNQSTYILRIISQGYKFNTRMARYFGIGNLHSIAPILHKQGYQFTLEHGRVKCPFTGDRPSHAVDILSMAAERIAHCNEAKTAKKL